MRDEIMTAARPTGASPGLLLFVLLFVLALGCAGRPAAAADPLTAAAAAISGDASRTHFSVDLSEQTSIAVFPLADPYRVVIDMPETRFALGTDAGKAGRGLISAYRYGLISPGRSRIVLDVSEPVSVDKAYVAPAEGDTPARLVVDLVPIERAAYLESVRRWRERIGEAATAPAAPSAPSVRPDDGRRRVVIDPGHGGIDSGAIGTAGTLEKDVVLGFAKLLKEKLEASGQYEVTMTRQDDTFLRLGERVEFARRHHADLFLSIHADSFRGTEIRGATVYTLSEKASDQMAASIAESENKSDVLAGLEIEPTQDDVADILIDLARRETKSFSVVFARNLVEELKPDVNLFKRPYQQAGFVVLKAPDVPSALVELGYLSNPEDEKLLLSEEWREKTASAIARSVDRYFTTRVATGIAP
ncbi:N-acetylmuramoyl-L-alanine amidase [Prosthecomicrobium pneumaticum]|uniref:N-acetylmuramoyl-L-alanine amidase n=1 Tax=Prosthecomicrobium pneumaticum TaxID=81895 RepID=A0A7W9FNW4_9HYPH|nr:N-acetylmuramoyl-L-alanine amidase [Prosthecomicrobium pneumaticum]MBB5754159.1 N-acetylmuramoyl-L-alanine amidase [Prosthecomicrobium pneumaticum]